MAASNANLKFRRFGAVLNWTTDMQRLTVPELLAVTYRLENTKGFAPMFSQTQGGIICRICSTKSITGKQNLDAHIIGKNHKRAVEAVAEYRHKTFKSLAQEAAMKKATATTTAKPVANKQPSNASVTGKTTETNTSATTAKATLSKTGTATATTATKSAANKQPSNASVTGKTTETNTSATTPKATLSKTGTAGSATNASTTTPKANLSKTGTAGPTTPNNSNKVQGKPLANKLGSTAEPSSAKPTLKKPAVTKTATTANKSSTQPIEAKNNSTAEAKLKNVDKSATLVVAAKEKGDEVTINDQTIETVDLLSDGEDHAEKRNAAKTIPNEGRTSISDDRETLNQIRMLKSVIVTMDLADLKKVEFRRVDADWTAVVSQHGEKFTCNVCSISGIVNFQKLKAHLKEARHVSEFDSLHAIYHPIICPSKVAMDTQQKMDGNEKGKLALRGLMTLKEFKEKHATLPLFELLKIEYRDKSNIWYSLVTKTPTNYKCGICKVVMNSNGVKQHMQGTKHLAAVQSVTEMHHPKYCVASSRAASFADDGDQNTDTNKKSTEKENLVLNPVSVFRRLDQQNTSSSPITTNKTAPPAPIGKSLPVIVGRGGATRNTLLGKRTAPTNHPGLQPPTKQAKGPQFATKTFVTAPEDDTNIEGYIGVEYVVKILLNPTDTSPKFECCLCEVEADGSIMQEHLKSSQHRLKYLDRHFRTCMREFEPYRNDPANKNLIAEIAYRLSVAVEKHHGRDLPYECLQEEYRMNRPEIMAKVFSFRHASEYCGPSMVHIIDKATLADMVANKHKFTKQVEPQVNRQPENFERAEETAAQTNEYLDVDEHRRLVDQFLRNTNRERDGHRRRSRSRGRSRGRSLPRGRSQSRGRAGRSRRSRSRSMGRRRSRSGDKWSSYKRMFDHASRDLNTDYKRYERDPETHPLYQKEWKIFWQKRSEELAQDGRDPRNYDFQPEWILFWTRRMDQIYEEELDNLKRKLRDRLNLPYHNDDLKDKRYHIGSQRQPTSAFSQIRQNLDNMGGIGAPGPMMMDVDQSNITGPGPNMMSGPGMIGPFGTDMGGPFAPNMGPNVMGSGGPNMLGPDGLPMVVPGGPNMMGPGAMNMMGPGGQNMMPPVGPNMVGPRDLNMMGPIGPNMMGVGGPNMMGPGGVGGVNMMGPGANMAEAGPINAPSQQMGHFEPVSQNIMASDQTQKPSAFVQHRNIRPIALEPNAGKKPQTTVSSIQRGGNTTEMNRRRESSPNRRDKDRSPVGRKLREDSLRSNAMNRQSADELRDQRRHEVNIDTRKGTRRNIQTDEEAIESGPKNIVSVLRLLTALEDNLGILGPKVVDLMTKALTFEKAKPGSADRLILTAENAVFLETVREKLRGQIVVGILDASKTRAVNNAIKDVTELLNREIPAEPIIRAQPVAPAPPRLSQPLASPNNPQEKRHLAMELASALSAQGKTNVSSEQLEQLIAVYSLFEKKQREATTSNVEPSRRQNLSDLLVDSLKNTSSRSGGNMGTSDSFGDSNTLGGLAGNQQLNQNRVDLDRFGDSRNQRNPTSTNTSQNFGEQNNRNAQSSFQAGGRSGNVNQSNDFRQSRSSSNFTSSGLSTFDTSLSLPTRPLSFMRNQISVNRQQDNFASNLDRDLDDDDDRQQSNFGDFSGDQSFNHRQQNQSNLGSNMNRYQDLDNRSQQQYRFENEMNQNNSIRSRQGDFGNDGNNLNRNQRSTGGNNMQQQNNFGNNFNRDRDDFNRQNEPNNFGNGNKNLNSRQQMQDEISNSQNSPTFMTNMSRSGNMNRKDLVAYPSVRQQRGGGMDEANLTQATNSGRNQGNQSNQQMPIGWQNNNSNRGGRNRPNNNQGQFRRRN